MTLRIHSLRAAAPFLAVLASATWMACDETEDLSDDAGSPAEHPPAPKSDAGSGTGTGTGSGTASSGSGSGTPVGSGTGVAQDGGSGSGSGTGAPTIGAGRLILFGGSTVSGDVADTWAWDGTNWTQLQVTGPGARDSAIGGKVGDKLVLFGGTGGSDTWLWDGTSWTASPATGPTGTDGNVGAALGDDLLVFYTDEAGSGHTWSFDGSSWSQLSNGSGPFQGLGWSAVTFQSQFSLFGNGSEWIWNGSVWNQSSMVQGGPDPSSPSAQLNVAPLGNVLVVFNGEGDAFGDMNQTWTWDGTSWTLHNVSGPSARSYASMATYKDTVVLFGGCDYGFDDVDGGTSCLGDTWTWDGTSWTQHDVPGPSARANAFLVSE